jgi:uncharacterized surface protein with fasciclin (FAS1) repeats
MFSQSTFVATTVALFAVASAQGPACSADIPTIGELAGSAPELSTLVAAVKAANLTDVLSLPGPIDVFAPTNDAFGALLTILNTNAETLLAETALLTNVLQYHVVVDGAVCSGDLSGAVETVQGGALTVSGSTVTDVNGNAANIVGAIDAGNGVVYVIDSVLLPPADDSTAASAPVVEGLSAQDVFNALDADGDGLVTEAELRAAAEYRGIQLTDEQVAAFLAADADGDGVDVDDYLTSLDTSVYGELPTFELKQIEGQEGRGIECGIRTTANVFTLHLFAADCPSGCTCYTEVCDRLKDTCTRKTSR